MYPIVTSSCYMFQVSYYYYLFSSHIFSNNGRVGRREITANLCCQSLVKLTISSCIAGSYIISKGLANRQVSIIAAGGGILVAGLFAMLPHSAIRNSLSHLPNLLAEPVTLTLLEIAIHECD